MNFDCFVLFFICFVNCWFSSVSVSASADLFACLFNCLYNILPSFFALWLWFCGWVLLLFDCLLHCVPLSLRLLLQAFECAFTYLLSSFLLPPSPFPLPHSFLLFGILAFCPFCSLEIAICAVVCLFGVLLLFDYLITVLTSFRGFPRRVYM